jgi:SAM-dependent methyltransferase
MLIRIKIGIKRRLLKFEKFFHYINVQKILNAMSADTDFPSSAGTPSQHLEQLLIGSRTTPKLLVTASKVLGGHQSVVILPLNSRYPGNEESFALNQIFDFYGSDKGTFHEYSAAYSGILNSLGREKLHILEIGLGTNNTDTLSNMGAHGSPGASLRAWRDYCPDSTIVGCDIDARVLFSEHNINTFVLDQTSEKSWSSLLNTIGNQKFDLIVDDGLHSPMSNLQTIIQASRVLSPQGYIVIEDIAVQSLPAWELFSTLVKEQWTIELLRAKHAHLAVIRAK